ncbi:MAG: efflux RND transporter periplasmic adaptor subunit [Cyclobacteriaceae bacterium]|nr:efflux RND transporter periplasmic adaptor subunit [Cytophagales bacterium]MBX2898413.1 efflux RND transporter periplasmic adaptor subunit [Cyclobacteriaceae bacterium]
MDKKIAKKTWTVKRVATYGGITLLVVFVAYQFIFADRRSAFKTAKDKLTISVVQRGEFKEFIPQTGTVEPARTVFLDAIEGGNIKRIVSESGKMLKQGDVILELTNLNRELTVLQQEASFNESINRARETKLNIMRNDLEQRQLLTTIQNQLDILGPQYERQKQLFDKKLIAKQEFEQTEANFKFNKERMRIAYEVYRADSMDRIRQLRFTAESEQKMMVSLNNVSKILDNLVIRAPIDGQLSTPHWEIGQAVSMGQRLGQVDIVGSFKVRVPIDELYLPKISVGLPASTSFANKDYKLAITYIYPTIQNGRFEVDMDFENETPQGIRRGQSLRMRIELGQASEELLLPVGGFYKDTGGNWVFVLESDGKAVRRNIKLGRKNTENFEVLEGLKPGDRVITSSYENFGNNEVLILD